MPEPLRFNPFLALLLVLGFLFGLLWLTTPFSPF